jgi:hypothetical protein
MSQVEYFVIVQVFLEALLLTGAVYIFLQFRKIHRLRLNSQEVGQILQDTHLLKDELLETLQARKAIITNLIKQLDQKVIDAQKTLRLLEEAGPAAGPRGGEAAGTAAAGLALRERVEMLHSKGCSVDQIASHLLMSKGEVMLILDLLRAAGK